MGRKREPTNKVAWSGRVISVQPRIRLTRSFDELNHSYLGYCLNIAGTLGDEQREFSIGVGQVAHEKHQFEVGMVISGESLPVADGRQEPVEHYKTSKLRVLSRPDVEAGTPPPWHGVPPDLPTYRARTPLAGGSHLRETLQELYLGLLDAGDDHRRSLESGRQALPL